MNVVTLAVVYLTWTLVSANAAPDVIPPACNSLKPATIDYQLMNKWSPFAMFRSSWTSLNCSQAIYVNQAGGRTDYTGTGILVQGSNIISYQLTLINNTLFKAVQCTSGTVADYQTVYAEFDRVSATFCVVNCADDGIGYNGVFCLGRTADDEAQIQRFLDTNLKGVPNIANAQLGCSNQQYCDL